MHSILSMSARRARVARPFHSSGTSGNWSTTWLGSTPASSSNQNAEMAVSARPFSGTVSPSTTSKTLRRLDATNSRLPSPAS